MLLYTHAVWGLALRDFFGEYSWLSPALVRAMEAGQYVFSFWFWVPEPWLWPAYAASMLILAAFTLGLWTRVTSALALAVAISYANRVPAALFGLDQINIMLTLYLTIGPSGAAFSLDRWLAGRRQARLAPPEPSAGANLRNPADPGAHVRDLFLRRHLEATGAVVVERRSNVAGVCQSRIPVARHDLARLAPLARQRHVACLGPLGAVFLRVDLAASMAAAGSGGGRALHVGIGACLGMWTFGLIMLVGCAAFLPVEWIHACSQYIAKGRPRTTAVTHERRGRHGSEEAANRRGEGLAHAMERSSI